MRDSLSIKYGLFFENLDYIKFSKWMCGQTCPMVVYYNHAGQLESTAGVYEYDLFRWIDNQKKGTPLIWD